MASKIAALQAKLGGGAMIMGGMRPGGVNPLLKKKKEQSSDSKELDNSALLDRPTRPRPGSVRKAKQFEELMADSHPDDDTKFDQSMTYSTDDPPTQQESDTKENETDENETEPIQTEAETEAETEVDTEAPVPPQAPNPDADTTDDSPTQQESDTKERETEATAADEKETEETDDPLTQQESDTKENETEPIRTDAETEVDTAAPVPSQAANPDADTTETDESPIQQESDTKEHETETEAETEADAEAKTEESQPERWDYDIRNISDDEAEDSTEEDTASKLSTAVDSKLTQQQSLVDILMVGPQEIMKPNTDAKEDDREVERLYETLEKADCASLLKKYLTKAIFEKLKGVRTEQGCDLKSCIRSGIDNLDSGIGVYASDGDAYNAFSDLLHPIIADYHKIISLNGFLHPKQNFEFDDNAFPGDLDPDRKFIISTRVRVARNIVGYPLRGGMNETQTMELEQKVRNILEAFEDQDLKGTYYPLDGMHEDTRRQLVDDHFLFKKGDRFLESAGINQFWPKGRGIFFNTNKTFLVWVNEEDHLRIISMEQGANIKAVFTRLQKAVAAIHDKLEFAYNEQFGYVTACPTNIGCGERASVHIKVPLTSQNKTLFDDLAKRHNLQIRGVDGEHSESKGGVYDVSNQRRLGITEWDGVKDLMNGCKELIESETKLQKAQMDAEEEEKKEKEPVKKSKKKKEIKKGKTDKGKKKKKGEKSTKSEKTKATKNVAKKKKAAKTAKTAKNSSKDPKKTKTDKSKKNAKKKKKKDNTTGSKQLSKPKDKTKAKGSKKQSKSAKKPDNASSNKKGGDLKEWMTSCNVFDKQLHNALVSHSIDSLQKLKTMDQKAFDPMVRKFRADRFTKVRDKKKRAVIDKLLIEFEKAWRKARKPKKAKKGKKKTKKHKK